MTRIPREVRVVSSIDMAFLAFRGDITHFSLQNTDNSRENHVEIQVFRFSKSCKSFKSTAKKLLPLGISGPELEFITVKCLLNSTTGIYQPFFLLRQAQTKDSTAQELHVLLMEDDDSLIWLGSFEIGHVSKTSDIEFYFCDGPTVCWTFECTVFFARYNSALEKFTTDSITVDNSMDEQSSVEFNLLWCGLIKNQIVAMGSKSEMTDDASYIKRWTCVNHNQKDVQEIPLVPNVYVPITTCCLVREPLGVVSAFGCNSAFDGVDVYLATNRGQLLNFVSGSLKNCWQLPFKDPCRMWMLELAPDEIMIMVASQTKKVSIVDCRKKQVLKEWNEVASVLTDDFLENGNEQVLLLPQNLTISDTGEFSKFYLIDVAKGLSAMESSQDSFPAQSQTVTDSLQKTARALRTTLQARETSLREAKMESHEKIKMVEHCCKVLKDITCSSPSASGEKEKKSTGLHCLLEGDLGEVKPDTSNPERSVPISALNVKEIWQRILYDQWIIGVDVENTGERAVSDLTVGLVSCQSTDTSYSSKTVFCGNNRHHNQQPEKAKLSKSIQSPSLKRKKFEHSNQTLNLQQLLPGNQTRLTALCSLPRFTLLDSCTMSVVVTWRSHCDDGSTDRHSMQCGYVTLCTEQVVEGSLQLNRSVDSKLLDQDTAALRSVSIETELVLQSSVSRPPHITAILKSSMKDVPVLRTGIGDHRDIFGQLVPVLHENGPLGGTGIVLRDEPKEGKVTLVTRNKNQVFLLLHRLRQVLPDDVRILADPALDFTAVKSSLCAINQEITNLQQNLHNLMQSSSKSHTSLPTSDGRGPEREGEDSDGIKCLREGFERKREREMTGRDDSLSELGDNKKLWDDFVKDQMTVDRTVAEM